MIGGVLEATAGRGHRRTECGDGSLAAWRIEHGQVNGVDVADQVIVTFDDGTAPKGGGGVMLLDEAATPEQALALVDAFSGRLGGPLADLVGARAESASPRFPSTAASTAVSLPCSFPAGSGWWRGRRESDRRSARDGTRARPGVARRPRSPHPSGVSLELPPAEEVIMKVAMPVSRCKLIVVLVLAGWLSEPSRRLPAPKVRPRWERRRSSPGSRIPASPRGSWWTGTPSGRRPSPSCTQRSTSWPVWAFDRRTGQEQVDDTMHVQRHGPALMALSRHGP